MPTKAELLQDAEDIGIDVPSGATKADIEALLGGSGDTEASASAGTPDAEPQDLQASTFGYLSDLTPAQRRYRMSHFP